MSPTRFISTRGASPAVELNTALLQGLAPDGGLYMPEAPSEIDRERLLQLIGATVPQTVEALIEPLFGTDAAPLLGAAVTDALDFHFPLIQLHNRMFVLELFHGPTLAFKDVGARVMARLLTLSAHHPIGVITATSGDTGGAVAHAFDGREGARVWILYPKGQVSQRQEKTFATGSGNVCAVAVNGTFDDCQRLAKAALANPKFVDGVPLTSANSINVGRLLPQVIYYAYGWATLDAQADLIVSVPSGNLGNLTAGLMAKRYGIPIGQFVAATNANDGFGRYLQTGRRQPRASVRTLSTAMDVGDPSNLERIQYLCGGDVHRLRREVVHASFDDDAVRGTIRRVADEYDYVLDPHTAVGVLAMERALQTRSGSVGIVLATAHPAKFAETVEPILGRPVPVPRRLEEALTREFRAVEIEPVEDQLREVMGRG